MARVGLAEVLQGTVASQRGTDQEVREHLQDRRSTTTSPRPPTIRSTSSTAFRFRRRRPSRMRSSSRSIFEPAESFDETYLTAQVAAHEEAVELFESAVEDADNVFVAAFATQQLPVLEQHLEHAQELLAGETTMAN